MQDIGTTRFGLRLGYTTGSCAAAAAKAAAQMLLGQEEICQVRLMTPKGIELCLDIENISRTVEYVECAVRKYSGDDPDVTDGLLVFARVERAPVYGEDLRKSTAGSRKDTSDSRKDTPDLREKSRDSKRRTADARERVLIDGGPGVGRVTRPGLEQEIGQAAINKVPRRMIRSEVLAVCEKYGYEGGLKVTVSIPGGEETAKKTFNPRLGIEGGLSVLGTTGIVEPMSQKALTDTIYLEMKMIRDSGRRRCFVTPGNYGSDFLKEELQVRQELCVRCSNYVGEAIDFAKLLGMKGILLVGHMGKFIKLAAGVMNTHSRQADCRMEVLAAHAALAGASRAAAAKIMECITTTEAAAVLREEGILKDVLQTVMERMQFYLRQRAGEELEIEAVMFSREDGITARTSGAERMLEEILRPDSAADGEEKR